MDTTEKIEQGMRLEQLLLYLDLSQTAVAQIIGQSQSYVSQMSKGSRRISRKLLQFIAKNHKEVNVGWLLNGEGEMILPKTEKNNDVVREPEAAYNTDPFTLLRREMNEMKERIHTLEDQVQGLMKGGKGE